METELHVILWGYTCPVWGAGGEKVDVKKWVCSHSDTWWPSYTLHDTSAIFSPFQLRVVGFPLLGGEMPHRERAAETKWAQGHLKGNRGHPARGIPKHMERKFNFGILGVLAVLLRLCPPAWSWPHLWGSQWAGGH